MPFLSRPINFKCYGHYDILLKFICNYFLHCNLLAFLLVLILMPGLCDSDKWIKIKQRINLLYLNRHSKIQRFKQKPRELSLSKYNKQHVNKEKIYC